MLMSLDTSTTSRGACCLAQGLDDAQDLVVGLALRQAGRQVVGQRLGLEEQVAASLGVAGGVELQAVGDVGALGAGQRVERAAGLAARCGRLPSCPSCGRRALPARSSAGRCRVPRSGTGSSGRASARWCPARTAWPGRWAWPCGPGAARAAARRPHASCRRCRLGQVGGGSVSSRNASGWTFTTARARVEVQGLRLFSERAIGLRPPPIFATALCEERAGAS